MVYAPPPFPTMVVLFAVLVVLNVADVWLTNEVLRRGGSEMNPIVRWLMDKLGREVGMILPKAVMLAVLGYGSFSGTGNPVVVIGGLGLAVAAYVYAAIHNYRSYRKLKDKQ